MKRSFLTLLGLGLFAATQVFSASLDNGVDPFNMGKGDWIWEMPQTMTALGVSDVQGVIDYEKSQGVQWITVKCGDSSSIWPQFDTNTIIRCHAAGIKIFGWAYVYGNNVPGEINVALSALSKGADGLIIDAEAEYETNLFNNAKAISYCQAIKQQYPNRFLAHGPSPSVHFHPTFPYLEFGTYCDLIMPQDYWGYRGITPAQMLSMMDSEFRTNFYNIWSGSATNAIKPICPVAQADQSSVAGSDETDFVNLVLTDASPLTPAGYHGVSFWDAQEHSASQWTAISNAVVTLMTNVSPAIPASPINRCVDQGNTALFTVTAYGAPTLTYQWRLGGTNINGATNTSYTVFNAQAINAGNYTVVVSNNFGSLTSKVAVLTVVAPFPYLQQVFADDFETNSATLWNLFQGSGNGVSDYNTNWAFDYSGQTYRLFGLANTATTNFIPFAPSTTNGTRLGLKVAVNKNDGTAATAGVSLYPAGLSALSNCVLRFDAWMNYAGGANGETASGTTEMLTCGLNHTGTRVNWLDVSAASTSDGTWFAVDGEGGSGSPSVASSYSPGSDYRTFKGNGAAVPTHLSFASSGLGVNGAQSEDVVDRVYRDLFAYPNYESPGVPGKHWVKVELSQYNGVLTWRLNGQVVAQRLNTSAYTNGVPMIGYMDPFASIASPATENFVIIDNVRVYSIVDPPVITAQPANRTNDLGTTASFTIAASGTPTLFYQWQKGSVDMNNGGNISGATTPTLTLAAVSIADAAVYRCVVTNIAGSAISAAGNLSLNGAPLVTLQPQNQIADQPGASVTFSVTTSGTAPLSYQWNFDGGPIANATNSTYSVTNVQSTNIGYYSVMVTNVAGDTTSSNASLQIGNLYFSDPLDADTSTNWYIASNQADSRATWSFDYSLRANHSGPGVPQNPYYTNSTRALKLEANISSGTVINAISLSPKTVGLTGDFQLRFDAWQNWVGTAPAGGTGSTESITAGICHPGNIVLVPQVTMNAGVFIAANGDGGASSVSVTVPDYAVYTNASPSGAAQLVSTNSGCYVAVNSGVNPATFHGNSYYANISGNPAPTIQTATLETSSTLAGAASQTGTTKTGNFGFKWHEVILRKSGTGTGNTNISWYIDGFLIASVINPVLPAAGTNVSIGYFDAFTSVAATNFEFGLFSNLKVESFTAAGSAPVINTQPTNASNVPGTTANFALSATSASGLRYQWQKNGTNLINGGNISDATNAALAVLNAQSGDAGTYRCLVLNDSAFTMSAEVALTIASIQQQPAPRTIIEGQTTSFVVSAIGAANYQWQWNTTNLLNGGVRSGANTDTLTLTGATTNDAGDYRVVVSAGSGSITSSVATLSVVPRPAMVAGSIEAAGVAFSLSAPTNIPYIIETTPSILPPILWTPMMTNLVPMSGIISYTNSDDVPEQYFRVRFP